MEVDLGGLRPEDRATIARYVTLVHGELVFHGASGPTADDLVEAARERAEREERERAEQEARERQAMREALEVYRQRRTRIVRDWLQGVQYEYRAPDWPAWVDLRQLRQLEPGVAEWEAELERERQLAHDAARAEWERREAERRAAEQAALEALRDWALQHGSERVRLLIEEEHRAWLSIAEHEYLRAHTPDGYGPLPEGAEVRERTKPTAADVRALREARALAEASGGVLVDPRMAWIVVWEECEDEEKRVADRYSAIVMAVRAPTAPFRPEARLLVHRRVPS